MKRIAWALVVIGILMVCAPTLSEPEFYPGTEYLYYVDASPLLYRNMLSTEEQAISMLMDAGVPAVAQHVEQAGNGFLALNLADGTRLALEEYYHAGSQTWYLASSNLVKFCDALFDGYDLYGGEPATAEQIAGCAENVRRNSTPCIGLDGFRTFAEANPLMWTVNHQLIREQEAFAWLLNHGVHCQAGSYTLIDGSYWLKVHMTDGEIYVLHMLWADGSPDRYLPEAGLLAFAAHFAEQPEAFPAEESSGAAKQEKQTNDEERQAAQEEPMDDWERPAVEESPKYKCIHIGNTKLFWEGEYAYMASHRKLIPGMVRTYTLDAYDRQNRKKSYGETVKPDEMFKDMIARGVRVLGNKVKEQSGEKFFYLKLALPESAGETDPAYMIPMVSVRVGQFMEDRIPLEFYKAFMSHYYGPDYDFELCEPEYL